jgi:hypothetical protein
MAGMRRIGAHISMGDILSLRMEAYLAVTTSSVQFGSHTEIEAGFAGFGVRGHLDFDALFCIDPFGFMVDFSAGVSITCADFTVGSVELSGHLSGPSPWRIRGHASISILFFDVDVDLPEITWGSADPGPLPPARDPLAVFMHELTVPANWAATSRAVPSLVRLRPGATDTPRTVHPMAELAFRQTAVPLRTPLARMDGVALPGPVVLDVATTAGPALTLTKEAFPPTQFLDLDDTAKLSSSGYAQLAGGLELDPAGARCGPVVVHDGDYETTVLGTFEVLRRLKAAVLADGVRLTAGHGAAVAAVRQPLVQLRDPAAAVVVPHGGLTDATADLAARLAAAGGGTEGAALSVAAGLAGVTPAGAGSGLHAGYAQALVATLGAAEAAGFAVARAWEVAT